MKALPLVKTDSHEASSEASSSPNDKEEEAAVVSNCEDEEKSSTEEPASLVKRKTPTRKRVSRKMVSHR